MWSFSSGPVTGGALREKLEFGKFDSLHIHARGISVGNEIRLALQRETGELAFIDEGFFAEIFRGNHELRLITLIACHGGAQTDNALSGLGPSLLRQGIPAVSRNA